MASFQMKGTKQEVMEMLQLVQSFTAEGVCTVELQVEEPYVPQHTYEYSWGEEQEQQFVYQMLTGVYND